MTQNQLNRAVARATGESRDEIRRLGFGIADPSEVSFDPEPHGDYPQLVDWDDLAIQRPSLFP